MLLILLVLILILAFGGGSWAYPRYGAWGWSPFGILLILLIIFLLFGRRL